MCSVTSKVDKWERKSGQGVAKSLTPYGSLCVRSRKVPGFYLETSPWIMRSAYGHRGQRRFFLRKSGLIQTEFLEAPLGKTK